MFFRETLQTSLFFFSTFCEAARLSAIESGRKKTNSTMPLRTATRMKGNNGNQSILRIKFGKERKSAQQHRVNSRLPPTLRFLSFLQAQLVFVALSRASSTVFFVNKCEIMNCDSLFLHFFNNFLMIFIFLRLQLSEVFFSIEISRF